jgi:pimeloyl-ACP methyl ester carboxylesterase
MNALPNVVLVHGGLVDGSSWGGVIERLQAGGYDVTAPQFRFRDLGDDVARLRQNLVRQHGPTVVAGHSYGGQIMTALGDDAPNVVALVYVAAFALDEGESLGSQPGPPPPALANLDIDEQGYAWNSQDGFLNHFASDVDPVKAKVMFATQQPFPISTFGEGADVMGVPAWRSLPSWYLITTEDQAIPPEAQLKFAQRMGATTVEVASNHLALVTHPDETAKLIDTAAHAVPVAA